MADDAREIAQERLDDLANDYLSRPGVDWGRMFGSMGLRVRGKVFAVAAYRGGLMVKIPAGRADELVTSGAATKIVMAGSERREWVLMPNSADSEAWCELLAEAYADVDEISP